MEALYKFHQDYGRMGSISGLFIAEQSAVAKAMGREVYFGEVLGKYSEVYFAITPQNVVEKSADQGLIQTLQQTFQTDSLSGFNPFGYLDEEEEEDDDE